MPNLRKRSSVLTYNDDAVFRAIENLRKFQKSGNKSSKPKTFVKRDNIPEVVYADDGRQFFPCYFCCNAFAFKHDQLSHMQQCNFRVAVAPELPSVQVNKAQPKVAPGLQSTSTSTKAVVNKAQHGILKPRGIVKVKHKIQNGLVKSSIFPNPASAKALQNMSKATATNKIQSGLLVPTTLIKVEPNAIQNVFKQNIVKKIAPKKLPSLPKSGSIKLEPNAVQSVVKKVAPKKLPNLPKSGSIKLEPNAIQNVVLKQNIVKKVAPKKLPNLPKSGTPVKLPNPAVKPKLKSTSTLNKKVTVKAKNNNIFKVNATLQGFKRQEVPTVQKATSNKFTFPKIKLGQHVESAKPKEPKVFNNEPSNICMHCGEVFESQTKLVQHKREKHTYPRIFVPSDKLKEYDEMYKQSDMNECTICHKPIAKTYWKRHLQTHTGEKNYFCSICNKPFGRKDHRDIHERKHIVDLMKNFGS